MNGTRILEIVRVGGAVVVTPKRDLSEFDFQLIENELLELARDPSARRVVLDFVRTDYLGSGALGMLLRLDRAVHARGGTVVLCNLSAHEREILGVVGLEGKWPAFSTLEEALRAVAA